MLMPVEVITAVTPLFVYVIAQNPAARLRPEFLLHGVRPLK